jgi:hypothetical protein
MILRGAPVLPGEADTLVNYLTKSFSPDSSPLRPAEKEERDRTIAKSDPPLAQYLPAGEGRKLVLGACTRCHDLGDIVSARKTATEWKRSISQMVKLGAPLMADEVIIVETYLSRSFGPEQPIPEELQPKTQEKGK